MRDMSHLLRRQHKSFLSWGSPSARAWLASPPDGTDSSIKLPYASPPYKASSATLASRLHLPGLKNCGHSTELIWTENAGPAEFAREASKAINGTFGSVFITAIQGGLLVVQ